MGHIHEAIYSRLNAFSGLTALITTAGSTRLYHGTKPQLITADSVVFTTFTPQHIQDYQGKGGLAFSMLQTDTFGADANNAQAIAAQIRLAIQGMPAGTYAGLYVHSGRALEELPWGWDDDAQIYRITSQFEICHNEPEPTGT